MKARFNGDAPEADVDPFFLNIYHQYQQGLMKYKALDYDDLIINSVKLLRNDQNVAHKIRSKFKHILVDEFQDVNQAQYSLILLLADKEGKNLFLIGDPNQAIYGFRGADDKLFFQIKENFPSCQIFSLKDNYRSHASIIDSAQQLISHNPQIIPLNLNSIRGKGPVIRILELPSEKAEGIAIVKEIATLMGGVDMLQAHSESGGKNQSISGIRQEGYGFSDFAILFRTSKQSDILEECLLKEGIPYRIAGHQGIMENSLIRQILAFLRWCYNPMDEHSLLQSLNLPFLPVTKRDKAKLFQFVMQAPQNIEHHNINEICSIPTKFPPQSNMDPRIETLSKVIIQFQQMSKEKTPSEFINQIISILEKDGNIKTHQKDLERLSMMAEEFKNATSLFDNVSMCREGDMTWKGKKWAEGTEMVNLMTIHASKGLEFPVVFICGCEADLLPYRYHDKEMNLNEERRLFYVGMTRAKDNLYLSWSKNRIWKGQKQIKQISPFLEEIPEPFFEKTLFTARIPRKLPNKQMGLW
jgi:superfamily I DNA/RNA helicase